MRVRVDPNQSVPDWLRNARKECVYLSETFANSFPILHNLDHVWFVSCLDEHEFNFIAKKIGNNIDSVIEIGLATCGTHFLLKSMAKRVISIDFDWKSIFCSSIVLRQLGVLEGSYFIHGDSRDPATIAKAKKLCKKASVLLIDGDHSYEAVFQDYTNYSGLVRAGGWIIFDDYMNPRLGVSAAIQEIIRKDGLEFEVITRDGGQGLAVCRTRITL